VGTSTTELSRILGRGDVLAVAFGAMIGFGWIVLTGDFLQGAGTFGAALAFVIGGGVIALVGLTYAELVSAMPHAGGEHNYVLRAIGSRAAFVTSWALVLGYVTVVAFEAVALPQTMLYLFPDMLVGRMWTVSGYDVYASWTAVGVVAAVIMTALNYVGVRPSAVFQTIAVLFLAAVGVALLFGSFVAGDPENMQPLFSGGAAGILTVLASTPFLFVGLDVIPQSAEEINLPFRQIGQLLVVSVGLAVSWYVVIMLTVGSAAPADVLAQSELAAADGMARLWDSDAMGTLLVLGGIAGILTSWNGFLIGASRLVYAMGQTAMLPRWFAHVHPHYQTPRNALLFIGGLSALAPLFGETTLGTLVTAGGLSLVIAYFMVACSFVLLRAREPEMERPFRLSGGTVVGPLAALLSFGMALLYLPLPGVPAPLGATEWFIIAAWVALGLVFLLRVPHEGPGPDSLRRMESHAHGGR
jgi:basic amino acid/polyamine antiporter, APA family